MANKKVVPRSLTEAYKKGEGDFSPKLVGLDSTSTPLYTLGNFQITTNLEPRTIKGFGLEGEWSDYYSLDNLNISEYESELIFNDNNTVTLNFDPTKIERYAYFGSLTEFVRVNVEQIILSWKGSLYVNKDNNGQILNTILNYTYDPDTNISNFSVPVSAIINKFNLNFKNDNSFSTIPGDISNVVNSYDKYFVWNNFGSFVILGFQGYTDQYQYVNVEVYGNAFPELSASTFGPYTFHIRPYPEEVTKFMLSLTDFQRIMLNTLVTPKYTFKLEIPKQNDNGDIIREIRSFTWPTTDKYNLDIDGFNYTNYITDLFLNTRLYDDINSDLISRKYVASSIHEYDTPGEGNQESGLKVQKLLRIYGREFDDIKKYIDGISFANVISYDKKDNISDNMIKVMAKTMGFDVLETIFGANFNLFDYNTPGDASQFDSYSRELTPKEIEIEYWRRLVINAWWLYKSKGTRKVLEFFLKMFGVDECLVNLDEYVYVVGNRLNPVTLIEEIRDYYTLIGLEDIDPSLDNLPIDEFGYPKPLPNTPDYYFQMEGGWYNGGNEDTVGNNPHFGPYDYGSKYIDKFKNFIDDQVTTFTGDPTTVITNLFNGFGNEIEGVTNYIMRDGNLSLQNYDGVQYDFTVGSECAPQDFSEFIQVVTSTMFYSATTNPTTGNIIERITTIGNVSCIAPDGNCGTLTQKGVIFSYNNNPTLGSGNNIEESFGTNIDFGIILRRLTITDPTRMYYSRAYVIDHNGVVIYGNTLQLQPTLPPVDPPSSPEEPSVIPCSTLENCTDEFVNNNIYFSLLNSVGQKPTNTWYSDTNSTILTYYMFYKDDNTGNFMSLDQIQSQNISTKIHTNRFQPTWVNTNNNLRIGERKPLTEQTFVYNLPEYEGVVFAPTKNTGYNSESIFNNENIIILRRTDFIEDTNTITCGGQTFFTLENGVTSNPSDKIKDTYYPQDTNYTPGINRNPNIPKIINPIDFAYSITNKKGCVVVEYDNKIATVAGSEQIIIKTANDEDPIRKIKYGKDVNLTSKTFVNEIKPGTGWEIITRRVSTTSTTTLVNLRSTDTPFISLDSTNIVRR
jgi:hypothetical protein